MGIVQPYSGRHLTPGEYSEVYTFENEFNGGRWENRDIMKKVVDGDATDTGHTGYTTHLRAGLIMGEVTSSGQLVPLVATATDGSQEVFGILQRTTRTTLDSTAKDRLTGPIIISGLVDPAKLIYTASTSASIVGTTYEYHLRKLLVSQGFRLTDALWEKPYGVVRRRLSKTADYTVTAADRNTRFDNAGAPGAVNFTLPATAYLGLEYWFYVAADQNVTVTAGTADTMIVFNDTAADSIAFSTSSEKVGAALHVVGNGAKWEVEVMLGAETQTPTIAT